MNVRYALLADVHGNLEALEAVLADLCDWPDVRVICAGDVVGYGPDPEACLELLRSWNAAVVLGNHEAMVLGRLDFSRCVHQGIRAALWTRTILSRAARGHLEQLPMVHRERDLVVCHATLDDLESYTSSPAAAERVVTRLGERYPDARMVVCGHTHQPMVWMEGRGPVDVERASSLNLHGVRRLLVNPGAVGQSRDGSVSARYARYDAGAELLSFHRVDYASTRTVRKLFYAGLTPAVTLVRPRSRLGRSWAGWRTRLARRRALRE
jgi:diadenosine tetraphosphatase ApaH/serine/threonine PP2A family protein phosphatase